MSPVAGTMLTDTDDQPSAPPVGVISYRFWERRFNCDPSVIGMIIQVNRVPVTLIGVTPPGFAGAMQIGEWVDIAAMEIPLLLGRSFTARDDEEAPKVAIVTHAFVRRYFASENPVGRRFTFGANLNTPASEIEIVGATRDAKYTTLREAEPVTIYLPAPQMVDGVANYYVRTAGDPAAVGSAIRSAVREIDPGLPVSDFRTQEQQIERRNSQERLFAQLSGFFGVAALVLACVGLYGLMSYLVVQRTGEIGLRLALGALPAQVLRMVLRESFTLVSFGLVLGLAGAYSAPGSSSRCSSGSRPSTR